MKPNKKLTLVHGQETFELLLHWLDEAHVQLSGRKHHSADDVHDIEPIEAQISLQGSEIQLRTSAGVMTGFAVKNSEGLWISLGDQTAFLLQPKRVSAGESEAISETEIHAPMTGKIVEVRAEVDQQVSEGEILVILEAMKMEFKLEAAIDGVIESVQCEEGQFVDLGQLLVKLAPEEAS